jgi:hypothetical protein
VTATTTASSTSTTTTLVLTPSGFITVDESSGQTNATDATAARKHKRHLFRPLHYGRSWEQWVEDTSHSGSSSITTPSTTSPPAKPSSATPSHATEPSRSRSSSSSTSESAISWSASTSITHHSTAASSAKPSSLATQSTIPAKPGQSVSRSGWYPAAVTCVDHIQVTYTAVVGAVGATSTKTLHGSTQTNIITWTTTSTCHRPGASLRLHNKHYNHDVNHHHNKHGDTHENNDDNNNNNSHPDRNSNPLHRVHGNQPARPRNRRDAVAAHNLDRICHTNRPVQPYLRPGLGLRVLRVLYHGIRLRLQRLHQRHLPERRHGPRRDVQPDCHDRAVSGVATVPSAAGFIIANGLCGSLVYDGLAPGG